MDIFKLALNFKFSDGEGLLNIDKRLINGLNDNNITHLGYLIGYDFQLFKKYRNFGEISIHRLETFLTQIGFKNEEGIHSWFHDESLEQEALAIVSKAIAQNKKISDFELIGFKKDKLDNTNKIKNYFAENQKNEIFELQKNFLHDYSLNRFVATFKEFFKDEYDGLTKGGTIIKLKYLDGFTLQTIGDSYNISRERIRQIIEKELWHFKKYATLKQIFLKEFLIYQKKNIWLILVQDQENKNILIKSKLKNKLIEYNKTNKNGLYDLLIKMYYGYLKNYIKNNYKNSYEFIEFE